MKKQHKSKTSVNEMCVLQWMYGKTKKDKIKNEYIQSRVGVALIEDKM